MVEDDGTKPVSPEVVEPERPLTLYLVDLGGRFGSIEGGYQYGRGPRRGHGLA